MKRSEMETQLKSRSRGYVLKSVGRPIGVLPIETSSGKSIQQRHPIPPRLPPSNSKSTKKVLTSSCTSSNTSGVTLASSRSTRDTAEGTMPTFDLKDISWPDIHFIHGPGNAACASARSLRQQISARLNPQDTRTITPYEILGMCQEEDFCKVYEVDLHATEINVIPDMEKFRKLRVLDLSGNSIKKIEHLQFSQDLRDLKLYDNKITKLEGLNKLKELCNLQLQHNKIESVGKGLSGLTKLKWLRLDNNKLTSLEPRELVICVKLTILDISNNNITNLRVLNYLPNLEELFVAGNNLQKLSSLSHCRKLMQIDLSHNHLADLSAISGLQNLQILDVSFNHLKSLASLGKLKSLEDLNASSNQISELSGLGACLPRLEILNLCDNKVTWKQVCCLKEVPELLEICLAGNPVMLERRECPTFHTDIVTVVPTLEIVDGAFVRHLGGRGGAAPLMRPMSASSVVSVRQVDMQLKQAIQEQESLQKSIFDRFTSLKSLFDLLPRQPPRSSSYRSSSSSFRADPLPPLLSDAPATGMFTRSKRRNRLREAQAFAAIISKDDDA